MKVLIIGAAGMIGRKLAERIAAEGGIGERPVDELVLVDVVEPAKPTGRIGAIRTAADRPDADRKSTRLNSSH